MKKLFFAAGIVCLLAACETKYYSVLITNTSSKTVSYTYNDSSDTLDPDASKTYEVKAYTSPPAKINDENGIASIEMKQDEDKFIFKDAAQIEMNILNTLPVDVKRIKAGNYISYKDSFLVSVPKGETISEELFIYTDKPNFSLEADSDGIIEPSYPIHFDWKITDELDDSEKPKKKLSLTIR